MTIKKITQIKFNYNKKKKIYKNIFIIIIYIYIKF